MRLVLGGAYKGRAVAEAFKRATEFEKTDKMKWVSEEFALPLEDDDKFQIKDGSLNPVLGRKIGVAVYRSFLVQKRKWILWGEKKTVWDNDADAAFVLAPLYENGDYHEVDVGLEKASYDEDGCGKIYLRIKPSSKRFKCIETLFEAFLKKFTVELRASK